MEQALLTSQEMVLSGLLSSTVRNVVAQQVGHFSSLTAVLPSLNMILSKSPV